MDQWKDKIALVTGASSGIGANISLALADCGMKVVAIGRRVELIEELVTKINGNGEIHPRQCDVTNEKELVDVFSWIKENFGGVDVLINNAGMFTQKFLIESETSVFKSQFDVNVIASCVCIREMVKSIRDRNVKGHIIFINSVLGHYIPHLPMPLLGVYPATKFSLTALSQTIQQEINFHRVAIKVTNISPGMVRTNLIENIDSSRYDAYPKLNAEDVTSAVLYALGTPEHVQIDEVTLTARPSFDDN